MAEEKNPKGTEIPKIKGEIRPTSITDEMQKAYLDYAMSVIVSRALPDIRDGLKPVQRRIIYAMHMQGMNPGSKYSKCAAVVGEVMKKYHPHGDMAIYDALVRMAQPFSIRYILVDGQGNFGSIDGDNPAAMRYTECRLAPISNRLLNDIEKETVEFEANYDVSDKEPSVLPASIPNLLLNGSSGIAVGMATNIPPHNLGEVTDALKFMISQAKIQGSTDEPSVDIPVTVEDLIKFIPGPDFPTGAQIYNQEEIIKAYATGKGSILMRAKTEIVEEGGKQKIIATELPYQVNKATLLTKMADLIKAGKVKGVSALRDESDKDGIRVVTELQKQARPQAILNTFFKHTQLQTAFHANMVALLDRQPKILTLKDMLEEFLKHRFNVVVRRTKYLLNKAREREHILQGLKIALDHLDEVIETIKKSKDADHARGRLVERFKLTEIQAQAILDMPLKRLSALEREKIEHELKDIITEINRLENLLSLPVNIYKEIEKELDEIKEKYSDERRTKIFKRGLGDFNETDLIPKEEVVITITKSGYIKRLRADTYRGQARGGKGVSGIKTKEEDAVAEIKIASTHDDILFFTNKGRVYKQKVYDIPEASRTARGTSVVNVVNLEPEETLRAILTIDKNNNGKYLFLTTKFGVVKKTPVKDFENIRKTGIIAIRIKEGDDLKWVRVTGGEHEIMLITKEGKSIRFSEKDVRSMGRSAGGVRGIKLGKKDEVVSMEAIENPKAKLLIITENGFGKKTNLKNYKVQSRGGSGILTANVTKKTGNVVATRLTEAEDGDILITSAHGHVIRTPVKKISTLGRATQGVRIMKLASSDKVASLTGFETEEEAEKSAQLEAGSKKKK